MNSLQASQSEPAFTTNGMQPVVARPAPPELPSLLSTWQQHYAEQEEEVDLKTLLSIVRRRAWAITGVAAAVMSVVVAGTVQQEKIYEGSFRMLVEPVNADNDLSDLPSILAEKQTAQSGLDYETQVQVLRSPELLEPLAEQLQQKYPELTYLSLLKGLSIARVGETKIIEVKYTDPNPLQIQVVLDQLSKSYLDYSLAERQTNLRQGINFVDKQLPELQQQVNRLQSQLQAFRQEYNFITPEFQSNLVSGQMSNLYSQRSELTQKLSEAQQVYDALLEQNDSSAALEDAPVYRQLLSELRSVETEIAKELTRFEPDSLAITVLEEQRDNILPLLEQEAQRVVSAKQAIAANNLQVLSAQNDILAQEEQQTAQLGGQLPALIRRYTDLQRELEVAVEALSRFRLTGETLEIEAAQTEIPWQLIEVSALPEEPISPSLPRNLLLGTVASLLLGLGAALLLEKFDTVYHSVDELKAGTKLPLLGTLPVNSGLKDSRTPKKTAFSAMREDFATWQRGKTSRSAYYGYGGDSESSFLEAVRVLYTNILMLSSDEPIRSILITSAQPGEGKSTTAAKLAQVATAMGRRVLVVDVDLRKPQVHERLGAHNALGLSNLIADNLALSDVLQQVHSSSQLFTVTAGKIPPDPTKLLSSQRMKQLMTTFAGRFDLVIYDAPPATGLADVSLLGQYTDGLVLVSRMDETDRRVLGQTVETLKLARIPVLGIVANGVKSSGLGGYRYYAYGYGEDAPGNDSDDGSVENSTDAFEIVSTKENGKSNSRNSHNGNSRSVNSRNGNGAL